MPDVKIKYFSQDRDIQSGQIDSLKLLKMIDCIRGKPDAWDKKMIVQHEAEMLDIILQGLNLKPTGIPHE